MAHAKLSPSKAHRWLHCVGSVAMEPAEKEASSPYAAEGTKAHEFAASVLKGEVNVTEDIEMAEYVLVYTDAVRRAAEGKLLHVEVPLDISKFTGEHGARGTADAVIVSYDTLEVHDLKYGMGHLVEAENNEQLMLYALGVLDLVEGFTDIQNIKLVIHQPRRDHLSECTISYASLMSFGEKVREVAKLALSCTPGDMLTPHEDSCRWCPAKATCPALEKMVYETVAQDFADVNYDPYPGPDVISLVETWLKAVQTAIFTKLQRFEPVLGWKLVLGREGNRKWNDEAAVEELLKSLRVTKGDSHEQTLKSPAQLEKLGLAPKKWDQVAPHITRNEAKPIMVDDRDPRPAVQPVKAEEFDIFK
jgi:hypothetical protein